MAKQKLSVFSPELPHPRVMVVSFERSGTHFMMNSMASCFGYISKPWINFDHYPEYVNFTHAPGMKNYLARYAQQRLAHVVKSHHPTVFFDSFMDFVTENYTVVYIYRNPLHTLRSFWKMIQRTEWVEGPQGMNCNDFLRTEPMGYLLRYQMHQEKSMVHRWRTHVTGWYEASLKHPSVVMVKYEDLKDDYEGTIRTIGQRIGVEPIKITKPPKDQNVVLETTGINYEEECTLTEADEAYVREVAGDIMAKLGY
uniref:Sulfotransferase domain-containing protein n=1 Tax=Magnetococcus massalia (strain MO-1) TaxID=451514 RepID=A0A1S7LJY5_MAGMO|nr:Protein of unknown function [Candidatus Magnetococcus massalia]